MTFLATVKKADRALVRAEEAAIMTLLLSLAVLQVSQVLFRYVLNIPLHWVDESSRFIFIFMIMVGAGLATANSAQFSIDFIKQLMPRQVQIVADVLVQIGVLTFAVVLLVHGIRLATVTSGQTTASLQLPYTVPYASMPLGGLLILFHALSGIPKRVAESKPES
jgi:TRAP-type transport system small permease protein